MFVAILLWTQIQTTNNMQKQVDVNMSNIASLKIGNCQVVTGPCGTGMFQKPTYYFDRVKFSCPDDRPIMNTVRFKRCGEIGQNQEGLQIISNCCALGE